MDDGIKKVCIIANAGPALARCRLALGKNASAGALAHSGAEGLDDGLQDDVFQLECGLVHH